MNNSSNAISKRESSLEGRSERLRSEDRSGMYLPEAIYESLPAMYVSAGVLLVLGALYIGFSHLPTLGYLAVGVSSILAGLTIENIRRRERSRPEEALA